MTDKELIERLEANEAALADKCGWVAEPQASLEACTDFDETLNFTADSLSRAAERIRSLVEENERLRLAILGGEDVPGVAASLTLDKVLAAHRDNQSFAESTVSRLSARVRELEGVAKRLDDCWQIEGEYPFLEAIAETREHARSLLQDEGGQTVASHNLVCGDAKGAATGQVKP